MNNVKHNNDEIDLVELAQTIWAKRKFITKVTGVFIVIGLIIAFTSPVEYEASTKLLPESTEGAMPNLGGLGGLAGLAGIDLGGATGAGLMMPKLYPEIASSLPFLLEISNDSIDFEQLGIRTTPINYFKEHHPPSLFSLIIKYTIGLPKLIKKSITPDKEVPENKSGFIRLSKEEWKLIKEINDRILLFTDETTGILTIYIEMPDPLASAQIAQKVKSEITSAVTEYKINKLKSNLEYIQKTYLESKAKYENVQLRMAQIIDENRNVSSAIAEISLKQIEQEYSLAFETYKQLAAQLEQTKLKLKEETPVFTILEPVRIPEDKSSPNRPLILVLSTIFGIVSSVLWLFYKQLSSLKNEG